MKAERQVREESKKRPVAEIVEALGKVKNKYFFARFLEISSLLSYLLDENQLKRENLAGPILDLGTGSGIGFLALIKFGSGAVLEGIDNQLWWSDPNWYTGFSYPVPLPGLLEAVGANFESIDILDCLDLRSLYGQRSRLVTAFYANTEEWGKNRLPIILEEIGEILPPGGQFLFTSDQGGLPQPDWASEEFVLTGNSGKNSKTLFLPFPNWLREHYWNNIQAAASKRGLLGLNFFLEDEIFNSDGKEIGLIRDSQVRLFTK